MKAISTIVMGLGLLASALHSQNILINGSFESSSSNPGFQLHPGDTNLMGWMLSGNRSIYWVAADTNQLAAVSGSHYVDLNGANGSVTLSQSFPTVPEETYEVSLSVGHYQGSTYQLSAAVTSSNGVVLTNVIAVAPNVRGWWSTTFLFVATTHTSTLHLTDSSATVNYDFTLDAVSVQRVTPRLSIECVAANLVTNGNFETPELVPGNFTTSLTLLPGSTELPGWSVSGASGAVRLVLASSNNLQGVEGRQYVDFNNTNAVLEQPLVTVPGEIYQVGFRVGRFQSTHPMELRVSVVANSSVMITNFSVSPPPNVGWSEPVRFRFRAATGVSSLRFSDAVGDADIDLILDGVSVQRISAACSQLRLCWDSVTNELYRLQSRSSTNASWTNLGAAITGTGGKDCVVEPITKTDQLFRVVRLK